MWGMHWLYRSLKKTVTKKPATKKAGKAKPKSKKISTKPSSGGKSKKTCTAKQLAALARGRKMRQKKGKQS